jgi:hypothetical protein
MPDYKTKLKSKDSNASIICDHLAELCSQNESFKSEVESREDRTVPGMMKYIKGLAKKQAQSGVAMVQDSTVFNWAFDYFHDQSIKVEAVADAADEDTEEEVKKEKPVKKVKQEKKDEIPGVERLQLFDL